MRGPDQTIIQLGELTAELLRSKAPGDQTWYVVIQPRNSRDILAIDRYPTFMEAKTAAFSALEAMNARSAEGQTA